MREILLLLLVVLSISWVFKRPILAMGIYLGANIVRPEMLFWGGGTGSYVFKLYFGLVIVTACFGGYLRNIGRINNRTFWLLVWLFIAVLVSTILSQYPVYRGYYYVVEIFKVLILCALLYMLIDEFSEIMMLQNILLGCFSFLGVWGIQQQLLGNERLEGLGGHSWPDSNGIAAVYVLFFPVALAKLFSSETRREFWTAVGIVVIMIALVVCTKSRGGLIGLVLSVVSYGIYSCNIQKIAVASLLMIVVAMPFVTDAYLERIENMTSEESLDQSAKGRLILWELGLMVFADNPIVGSGFLTYPVAKMQYRSRMTDLDPVSYAATFRTTFKKVTHNTYIQMLSDCGLFGALPFFILVVGGIFSGIRTRRLQILYPEKRAQILWLCGLSAGLTGYAACIFFIDAILQPFIFFQLVFIGILSRMVTFNNQVDQLNDTPFRA